jgi:hypothetical protein
MPYSTNPLEEAVLEYRPNIAWTPEPLRTIDNAGPAGSSSSFNASTASAVTLRYLAVSALTVQDLVTSRYQTAQSLLGDVLLSLDDDSYTVPASEVLQTRYGLDRLTAEDYKNLAHDAQVRDEWVQTSFRTAGNLRAEALPLLLDMVSDLDRSWAILEGVLLYGSGLAPQDAQIAEYLQARAERCENSRAAVVSRQIAGESPLALRQEIVRLENEFRLDNELAVLCSNSALLIDQPLAQLGNAIRSDLAGTTRQEALDYLQLTDYTARELKLPLLYEHRATAQRAVQQRLTADNHYSQALKASNLAQIKRLGRSWKGACLPALVKMLATEYNDIKINKLMSHVVGGLAEINRDLTGALQDYYKMALGDYQSRTVLVQDLDYKNMARTLYNHLQ